MSLNEDISNDEFDWYPHGIDKKVFIKYLNELPEDMRPLKNTQGALNRYKLIEQQFPLHDFDEKSCESIENTFERDQFNRFFGKYAKNALGIGQIMENKTNLFLKCQKCLKAIKLNRIAISALNADLDMKWHPTCFTCELCDELLVDLIYFQYNKQLYCSRHFSQLYLPRCVACDELIFSNEFTKAEEGTWHLKHFCCWKCDCRLGGERYVTVDSRPYCINCYDLNYAKKCAWCNGKINANSQLLTYENTSWHANSNCFACFVCRTSLLDKNFIFKNNLVFCSVECKRRIIPKNSNQISRVIQF